MSDSPTSPDTSFDPLALALPPVRTLRPYQPGKSAEAVERELGIRDIVKLASNENPLGASARALRALAAATDIGRYPDGNGTHLKEALAARWGVDSGRVTLGSGSSEILELAVRTFAGTGHEVLYAEHGFAVYPLVTMAAGATGVAVADSDYAQDLEATLARIGAATRLLFIANPNNPTGTWFTGDTLYDFLRRVPRRVLVVVDEAYAEYMDEAHYPGYRSAAGWLDEFPNLIVTRSFSKAYGLAGLRVGYGLCGEAIADLLNRVRQPFNVNLPALAAACAALEDEEFVRRGCALNRRSMDGFCRQLEALGLPYLAPSGNFVTFSPGFDGALVFDAMQRRGVIVRALHNYGMPAQLRVTMGTDDEMVRCCEALKGALLMLAAAEEEGGAAADDAGRGRNHG